MRFAFCDLRTVPDGLLAPERAAGITLREARRARCEAAALAMGHVAWRDGQWCIVLGARPPGGRRIALGLPLARLLRQRSGMVIASSRVRPRSG